MNILPNKILHGECLEVLKTLPDNYFNTCVTSPPYWGLRDYGVDGQIGLEETPEQYVNRMVEVFREVRRVLRDDGTLWLNLGDTYCSTAPGTMGDEIRRDGIFYGVKENTAMARRKFRPMTPDGLKPKDLVGIPWRVAFALQEDGWYLRKDIIWHKPNCMPESVRDRPTSAHEYIFLLSKSQKYYYDSEAIKEPTKYSPGTRENREKGTFNGKWDGGATEGQKSFRAIREFRSKRSVWTVATQPFSEAHFATFPEKLVEPCILAGSPVDGIVLDPFFGSGTTGVVSMRYGRKFVGIELNPEYIEIAKRRLSNVQAVLNFG